MESSGFRTRRRGVARAGIAVLCTALVAVATAFAISKVTGPTDDEAKAAINDLLARRYNAIVARDLDAYLSIIDPARTFLRDCARQRFEAYVRTNEPVRSVTVGRVERWGKYLRMWVGTEDLGWWRAFARYDGGRWYASEPLPSELGDHLTKEYAGVKVHYLAEESDLAAAIGKDLDSIMAKVMAHAAEAPSAMFELEIATLSDPGGDCFVAGAAERWGTTVIKLNDVRLSSTYDRLSPDTVGVIEHEALHWLQQEHATLTKMRKAQRPHWWVVEGWPTAIANSPSGIERRSAACTAPPSYDDLRLGIRFQAKVEDVERTYVIAAMLIERVAGTSDNAAYWRFFDDFGASGDPYVRATGSDGRTFYATWLEETRSYYCSMWRTSPTIY